MRIQLTGVCLAISAIASVVCATQHNDEPELSLKLLEPIRELHRQQQNIGFSFVMTHRGKVVLRDYAGLANLAFSAPIEQTSRFSIMSITKAFTGLIVLKTIARNKLKLTDSVSLHLPDYRGPGADKITIAMLLAHTSGITHTGHPQRKSLYVEHFDCATDSLMIIEEKALAHEPGTAYLYSSSGYNLLAAILEKVWGACITEIAETTLFTPLQLQNTGYLNVQKSIQQLVRNYSFVDMWDYQPSDQLQLIPNWDFSYNMGGGNMYSSVDDLVVLGNAILEDKQLPDINKSLLYNALDLDLSRWSAGFITSVDTAPLKPFYITGATPGVQASLFIYPEQALVFAMLANSWGKDSAGGKLVIDAPQQVVERYLQLTASQH